MYLEFGDLLLSHKQLTSILTVSTESKADELALVAVNNQDEKKEDEKQPQRIDKDGDEEITPTDDNNNNVNNVNSGNNGNNNKSLVADNDTNNDQIGNSDEDITDPITWFEKLYSAVVESISTADFVTDCFVLKSFVDNNHQWWSTWMILSMMAPYLVSYSVFGSLFNQKCAIFLDSIKSKAAIKRKCNLILFGFFGVILLTPLSLLYFLLIDCFFMLYVLISSIILVLSCTNIDIKHWVDDFIFQKILSMNKMQILGYRRTFIRLRYFVSVFLFYKSVADVLCLYEPGMFLLLC